MNRRHRNRGNRKQLLTLWTTDPHCTYCGCLTEMPKSGESVEGEFPPNLATRDHVYSRLDPRRHDKTNPDRNKVVLSCYKCNHDRNQVEQSGLPKKVRSLLSQKQLRCLHGFQPYYPNRVGLTNINLDDIVIA